jgi:hypothetical protein
LSGGLQFITTDPPGQKAKRRKMNSTASEEAVLMPELWDLVFNWVSVTEGLATWAA